MSGGIVSPQMPIQPVRYSVQCAEWTPAFKSSHPSYASNAARLRGRRRIGMPSACNGFALVMSSISDFSIVTGGVENVRYR